MGLIIIPSEFRYTEFKQLLNFGTIIEYIFLGVFGTVLGYCLEAVDIIDFPRRKIDTISVSFRISIFQHSE